ncbi:YdcF family protein [Halobacillus sp. A5]|uniref:YdcF family protein n=1 Tax=Halobacillus sp. A5 TaxID=2880263 RepID=UPI0020A696B2|nr:YdcF family protein [Halobacillus sp. A5]MCP3027929.1 YdcF family protein [Halobacillus sp. A5]
MADHTKIAKKFLRGFFLIPLFILIIVAVVLTIFGPKWLVIEENAEPSDAVIVLSGNEDRLKHAAKLYEEGKAETIILSNSTESGTKPEEAMKAGIEEEDIISEEQATSTYENAGYTKDLMKEHELKSAIVVTSNYHSLRSKLVFERVYSGEDLTLTFSPAPSYYDLEDGMSKQETQTTFSEWIKIFGYLPILIFGSS